MRLLSIRQQRGRDGETNCEGHALVNQPRLEAAGHTVFADIVTLEPCATLASCNTSFHWWLGIRAEQAVRYALASESAVGCDQSSDQIELRDLPPARGKEPECLIFIWLRMLEGPLPLRLTVDARDCVPRNLIASRTTK
jgi:hypothetical protein